MIKLKNGSTVTRFEVTPKTDGTSFIGTVLAVNAHRDEKVVWSIESTDGENFDCTSGSYYDNWTDALQEYRRRIVR